MSTPVFRRAEGFRPRRLTLTLSDAAWDALADLAFPHLSSCLGDQSAAERLLLARWLEPVLASRGHRPLAEVVPFCRPDPAVT